MRSWKTMIAALSVSALLAVTACSDDGDSPKTDTGTTTEGGGTKNDLGGWACPKENIGKPCNAHDSCAINPICRPSAASPTGAVCLADNHQDCDDGLDCTKDTCAGNGVCNHEPEKGWCAVRIKKDGKTTLGCVKAGETHPTDQCLECAPETSPDDWSPKNGGSCDDGNPCTKDDYCQAGTCKGSDYSSKCSDQLFCTVDCDGKGGCLTKKTIDPKTCLISGECYNEGAKNPLNCSTCDPGKNQTSWTPTPSTCLIDNACYNPGDKHPGGCAECDPSTNTKAWTVKAATSCLIGNVCRKPGDQDSIKCGECDPTKDKYGWTPISGKCKIGGTCYAKGEQNTGKCAECDPAVDAKAWTVKGNNCLIDGACKNPQDTDTNGCQECDPTKDKYAWSAVAGKCKIGANCYTDGALEPKAGCLACTYAKTPTFWSLNSAVTKQAFDFDTDTTLPSGMTLETISGSNTTAKWQVVSGKESWSGQNALYYGDTTKMNYATGLGGSAVLLKNIAIPAGKKAQLVFKTWLDINASGASEAFQIFVGKSPLGSVPPSSAEVWHKGMVPSASYKTWVQQVVDLSSFAGQTIDVRIQFIAYQVGKPGHKGIFIDDLWLLSGC